MSPGEDVECLNAQGISLNPSREPSFLFSYFRERFWGALVNQTVLWLITASS